MRRRIWSDEAAQVQELQEALSVKGPPLESVQALDSIDPYTGVKLNGYGYATEGVQQYIGAADGWSTVRVEEKKPEIISSSMQLNLLAAGSYNYHAYRVDAGVLDVWQIIGAGAGKFKLEVRVGRDEWASSTKLVMFGGPQNLVVELAMPIQVRAQESVFFKYTNLDSQSFDIYSTFFGEME